MQSPLPRREADGSAGSTRAASSTCWTCGSINWAPGDISTRSHKRHLPRSSQRERSAGASAAGPTTG